MRHIKRIKEDLNEEIFIIYIISFYACYFCGQAFGSWQTDVSAATKKSLPKAPSIIGESAILIEPTTGTIIYEKDHIKKCILQVLQRL